jgi:hypothetical protein
MYAELSDKLVEIVQGLAAANGIRHVGAYAGASLEAARGNTGGLPAVFVQGLGSEPGIEILSGHVRTERFAFGLVVVAADWRSFEEGQASAASVLEALRDAFNPRTEIVGGKTFLIKYVGWRIEAVDLPVLFYRLFLDVHQK